MAPPLVTLPKKKLETPIDRLSQARQMLDAPTQPLPRAPQQPVRTIAPALPPQERARIEQIRAAAVPPAPVARPTAPAGQTGTVFNDGLQQPKTPPPWQPLPPLVPSPQTVTTKGPSSIGPLASTAAPAVVVNPPLSGTDLTKTIDSHGLFGTKFGNETVKFDPADLDTLGKQTINNGTQTVTVDVPPEETVDADPDPDREINNRPPMTDRTGNAEDIFIRNIINDANVGANTTEEEQLIRDEMDRLMGVGLVNSRARAGNAGFAASGGQIATEGGIRRDAALGSSKQINDLRRKEDQRAKENAFSGIDAEIGLRGAEMDAQILDMVLELIDKDKEKGPGLLGDADGDDEVSDDERTDFTQSHQTVDLGLGGDDTPGSPDTPYLTTTAEMTQMERAGYVFTLDEDYNNGIDHRYIDQNGDFWFRRGQT
jgi:hypothetical protein